MHNCVDCDGFAKLIRLCLLLLLFSDCLRSVTDVAEHFSFYLGFPDYLISNAEIFFCSYAEKCILDTVVHFAVKCNR